MICRKVFFLAGLTLCVSVTSSLAQTVTSARNGAWNDPATWEGGNVPTLSNASLVMVNHDVTVTSDVSCYSLQVSARLQIDPFVKLHVYSIDGVNGTVDVSGSMEIFGSLLSGDGVKYTSSGPTNIAFRSGGSFILVGGPKSYIPIAAWDLNSTFLITGFKSSGYINLSFSEGWRQSFGNVVYDCPMQSTFVDLNGHLRSIRGDFTIRNTNSNALRLCTTQKPRISVAGDLQITGRSEVWFNTTSDSATFDIGGDFVFQSTATGPTYFATRGRTYLSVAGSFLANSLAPLRICSGSTDSTGVRKSTITVKGNVDVSNGTVLAPLPGKGTLIFSGTNQSLNAKASSFSGNFDYHIMAASVVDVGNSVMGGAGKFFLRGHLKVGSSSVNGPFDQGTGNIRVSGTRSYYSGASIEYNGDQNQFVTATHPAMTTLNFVTSNSKSVIFSIDMITRNVVALRGSLNLGNHTLRVSGDLEMADSTIVVAGGVIEFDGVEDQQARFGGCSINEIKVLKKAGTILWLKSKLMLRRRLDILGEGNIIDSDGNLILLSVCDRPDSTAQVGILPPSSSIRGNVVVQRFMSSPNRMYRYISSPVINATVADLKDDFPVTGLFADPSTGKGIKSDAPSLFFFDDSNASGDGWVDYPSSGMAKDNVLGPGRGYAAYNRTSTGSTTWDVKGELNQGQVPLPVQYSETSRADVKGWNLVGNPYASTIDWGKTEGWDRSDNISNSIAIRDNIEGRFRYSDGEIGDASAQFIASGQAFWVRTLSDEPHLIINEQAKVNHSSSFFKPRAQDVSYLSLSVTGGGVNDNAFIRLRAYALKHYDKFDAEKKLNDVVSLAFLTPDSIAVAISAMDSINCLETFPVFFNVNNPQHHTGDYQMTVASFGLFRNSSVTVVDKYTNRKWTDTNFSFSVDDNPSSYDSLRFEMIIDSRDQSVSDIQSRLKELDCRDSVFVVEIINAPQNSIFQASRGIKQFSMDSLQQILIPNAEIEKNVENRFMVQMKSLCTTINIDTIEINLPSVPSRPVVYSAKRCADSEDVFVRLAPPRKGVSFEFFNERNEFLFRSHTDSIVHFTSKQTKRLLVYSAVPGCRSDSSVVKINVVEELPPLLNLSHGILISNYAKNTFYRDGVNIGDSVHFVQAMIPGHYESRVRTGYCDIESSIEVLHEDVSVTPVPCVDKLEIDIREGSIDAYVMLDEQGRIVGSDQPKTKKTTILVGSLPRGLYFLKIFSGVRVYYQKVIK